MSVSGVRKVAWDPAWKRKKNKKFGYRQNIFANYVIDYGVCWVEVTKSNVDAPVLITNETSAVTMWKQT